MELPRANQEVDYRLCAWMLTFLLHERMIATEEAEAARKDLLKKFQPPVGDLDGGLVYD